MYSDEHLEAIRSYDIPGTPTPLFVEIEPFGARWARRGLSAADLHVLQAAILAGPEAGVVVPGTNGLRGRFGLHRRVPAAARAERIGSSI